MNSDKSIIERIKKLLAMANDSNSPNEAAIAAARARKLMDMHQIEQIEVEQFKDSKLGEVQGTKPCLRMPIWYQCLCASVAKFNDTHAKFKWVEGKKSVYFLGYESDAIIAKTMVEYLSGEIQRLCNLRDFSTRGQKVAFKTGAMQGISYRLDAILKERQESAKTSNGKGLVVCKMETIEAEFGKQKYRNAKTKDFDSDEAQASIAGHIAAKGISLSPQVAGTNNDLMIESTAS